MIRYERRSIAALTPDPNNPRTIDKLAKRALSASMRRFGLVQPIVINERTGHVVGGHQRLDVLREQGETEVDVAIGSWSEQEERVLSVALNNPEAQGKFAGVRDYLSDALKALSLDDFQELRLDSLIMDDPKKTYRDRMTEVEDVDVSTINDAHVEIIVRCRLDQQERLLALIKHAVEPEEVSVSVQLATSDARG